MQVRLMNTTSPQFTAGDFAKIETLKKVREGKTAAIREAEQALAKMRSERSKKAAQTKAALAKQNNIKRQTTTPRELENRRRREETYTPVTDMHLDPYLSPKRKSRHGEGLSDVNIVREPLADVFRPSINFSLGE